MAFDVNTHVMTLNQNTFQLQVKDSEMQKLGGGGREGRRARGRGKKTVCCFPQLFMAKVMKYKSKCLKQKPVEI